MDIVPELIEPRRNSSNARREATEIPIQDQQPRPHDKQPQVAGALPQRTDRVDMAGQIDSGSIKRFSVIARKERTRKDPFRLREEVQVIGVAREV